jgi:phosphoribosylformylglycinamidine cyclo-ligase
MPGFYPVNEYDLAGYCTGIVDKDKMIDNSNMKAGDIIIALPSSGVHSNGFSLVRRVFALDKPDLMAMRAGNVELGGKSMADVLLEPTKIYVKPILALIDKIGSENIKGISHITGGGFYENIPRSIPAGLCARIARKAIRVLPIFDLIASVGVISDHDMFNTFNMGVGMTVIVSREAAPMALNVLRANGEDAYVIGEIVHGSDKIVIE